MLEFGELALQIFFRPAIHRKFLKVSLAGLAQVGAIPIPEMNSVVVLGGM